ncbi:MAG: 3-dehydroquinate synthase, partial [Armatimonadetes bacterium CG17_big_fil_post_rev_8_21_14_2_50_66_6]
MRTSGTSISVELEDRSYRVHVQPQGLAEVGRAVASVCRGRRCLLVSCRRVVRLWGEPVVRSLESAGVAVTTALVPDGEQAKSLQQAEKLYEALLRARFDRQAVVVSLGGGVVGDLAGFVAATYQRGVDFVQVPTTLLAQVDASVGGKTAVNHPRAKNMIGAFHQPRLVMIDPVTLSSLPKRQLRGGLAEVIKHGVILDARLFRYVEQHADALLAAEPEALKHVIRRSCQLKAEVVTADERESGLRAILNYGHTLGHAVESASAGRWLHGECVSLGMMGAAYLAEDLGMVTAAFAGRQRDVLRAAGLPVRLPGLAPEQLWERMSHDKKAAAGSLRWVLPTRIGEVRIVSDVSKETVLRA